MRYLVTGGAGFVGSHLVDALVTRGDSVVVLDDLSTGRRDNLASVITSPSLEFVEGSTLDLGVVERCLAEADACFHLASTVGVRLIIDHPLESLLNNVNGAQNVILTAARVGRRLLFTSTSEIYGKNDDCPLAEDADRIVGSPLKSRWSYSMAKAFGESMAHELHRERGAETVVTRLFNTVGPRQRGRYGMVLPRFVMQALDGEDLTVYGNGTQTRCFTHIHDVVQALMLLMDTPAASGKVFNIGAPRELAVIELARRVIERASSDSRIRLIPYEEAFDSGFEELGRRVPDISALAALTAWQPTRTIDDAVDDVIEHERHGRVTERDGVSLVSSS